MNLVNQIEALLSDIQPDQRCIIAYSGGIDSHVLLHLIASLRIQHATQCLVVHINHQLNNNANHWEQHCASICKALNMPFSSVTITMSLTPQDSIEAVAPERVRVRALPARDFL